MTDRILVTGGAGFIGSRVALGLKQLYSGADVVALDNLRRRGSELNIPRLQAAGVRFLHGDVRRASDLDSVEADLIIECSAEPSAQAGYNGPPNYVVETNLFGCYNCLELARRTKADFIFLSTSRVYPVETLNRLRYVETPTRFEWTDGQAVPGASSAGVSEQFPMEGIRSVYGMTKYSAEFMIAEFAAAYGFRYAINRCGLIAGPWQMGKSDQGVVSLWVASHYFGRPLQYIGFGGEGKQVRDILHVDDLSDLIARQAGAMTCFDRQTFNVGGGPGFALSLQEATALCEQITGRRIAIGSHADERPADIRVYVTDSRKLLCASAWAPQRDPATTLGEIHKWIRTHESQVFGSLFAPAS